MTEKEIIKHAKDYIDSLANKSVDGRTRKRE